MGRNGGQGHVLLAGGSVAGLWFLGGARKNEVRVEPWRRLTRAEHGELDDEIERVRQLLATPAYVDR